MTFFKKEILNQKSDRQIFSFGPILSSIMMGYEIKSGKKLCSLNFAKKFVFSSLEEA